MNPHQRVINPALPAVVLAWRLAPARDGLTMMLDVPHAEVRDLRSAGAVVGVAALCLSSPLSASEHC